MSQIPDNLPAEAKTAEKIIDRKYLVRPVDEVPDPRRPGEPDESKMPRLPVSQRIVVNFDIRKIAEAVNDAVVENDIDKVVELWKNAKIVAEKRSEFHVEVYLEP